MRSEAKQNLMTFAFVVKDEEAPMSTQASSSPQISRFLETGCLLHPDGRKPRLILIGFSHLQNDAAGVAAAVAQASGELVEMLPSASLTELQQKAADADILVLAADSIAEFEIRELEALLNRKGLFLLHHTRARTLDEFSRELRTLIVPAWNQLVQRSAAR